MNEKIVGVDEAGRGPLAGPVVAAAVMFKAGVPVGLADSKKLSAKKRAALVPIIQQSSYWAVAVVDPVDIDRLNILQASLLAMRQAVEQLPNLADALVQVDGNILPNFSGLCLLGAEAIVQGDSKVAEISAASILAKEHRDALMRQLDIAHPEYGFAKHSGYPVPQHLAALRAHGPTSHHRRSFAPVQSVLSHFSNPNG